MQNLSQIGLVVTKFTATAYGTGQAVPEPTSGLLLLLGMAGLASRLVAAAPKQAKPKCRKKAVSFREAASFVSWMIAKGEYPAR